MVLLRNSLGRVGPLRPRIAVVVATLVAAVALLTGGELGAGLGTASASAGSAVAAVSDPPYFADRIGATGKPVFIMSAEDWGLMANAGLQNGGDADLTWDQYFAARGSQGYNGVEINVFNTTNQVGARNGDDWDGTLPFTDATGRDPTSEPDATFWGRRDSFFSKALAAGFYVFANASTTLLEQGAFTASWTTAQWEAFGTFLGGRYPASSYPNIMWMLGDDYFGELDTNLTAFLDALRAAGGTQPVSYQGYQETSSRRDFYNGSTALWGHDHADFNWGYSYNATYDAVEQMARENDTMPAIPYMFGDGTFLNSGLTGITSDDFARRMIWWALSSGSKGFSLGDNNVWTWGPTALTEVQTASFYNTQVPAITSYWRSLPDWQRLVADTSSELVTAGRGTHIAPIVSGGSGTYLSDDSDSYVTASRSPDGTLAVIYLSHPSTITIDESKMLPGYRATWVDPASGATRAVTPDPTYDSWSQGPNSVGDADWVLVMQADTAPGPSPSPSSSESGSPSPSSEPVPSDSPSESSSESPSEVPSESPSDSSSPEPPPSPEPSPAPTPVTETATADLRAVSWTRRYWSAILDARLDMTYDCTACDHPERPIEIQAQAGDGSWHTLRTGTVQDSEQLMVRVPYRFWAVRVVAPAIQADASTTFAEVVSNTIPALKAPGQDP